MEPLLVLVLAVGLVSADSGYQYRVPETSYGVPAYQYNNAGFNTNDYKTGNSAQAGYQGASFGQQNLVYQTGYQSASALGVDKNSAGYQTGNYQNNYGNQGLNFGYNTIEQPSYQYSGDASRAGYQGYNHYQTSSAYQTSAVQKYQEFYNQWNQQPAQVFKHFYVHAAPEEPEVPRKPPTISLPPPQKHYKIIFIKAPSQTVYKPQYIPVPQQNEEKTIVYVLVKKPEEQQEIVVPKVEQKAPAKPEVFFIKYNNKADSSAVINNIVNDYNKVDTVNFAGNSGSGVTELSDSGHDNNGLGQYQTQTGKYDHANTGQYSQGNFGSQFTTGTTGTQSFGGVSTQSDSSAADYSGSSSTGFSAGTTAGAGTSFNAISTSQGVPHETYGPPTFRV